MLPHTHAILGALFSIAVWFFIPGITPLAAVIIFLASVFIDIDHYTIYVAGRKEFSLKKAYDTYKKLPLHTKPMPNILHTVEVMALILIAGFFIHFFLYVFIGFAFHSILDLIDFSRNKNIDCREYFLTRYLIKKKKNIYFDWSKDGK